MKNQAKGKEKFADNRFKKKSCRQRVKEKFADSRCAKDLLKSF